MNRRTRGDVAGVIRRTRGDSDHDLATAVVTHLGTLIAAHSPTIAVAARVESPGDVTRIGRWLSAAPRCSRCVLGTEHTWHDQGDRA